VVRAREKSLHVIWNSTDGISGYTLTITSVPGSSDPQWRMILQQGSMRKDLWFYISNDINKIFSMCVASLGEDLTEALAADAKAAALTNTGSQVPGVSGGSGMAGSQGMSGMAGMHGKPGMSGTQGLSSPSGLAGMHGAGSQGMSGMQGTSGMQGMSGMQGTSGMHGGMQGMSAMQGMSGGQPTASNSDLANLAAQQRASTQIQIGSPTELLTGNLAVLHITNLLQSISMGKMTGRLHIEPDSGPVEVFFEGGAPVHSLSRQASGEEAFLEVVALNNGSFIFEPNLKTDTKTITRTLDSLILKGIQILDCQAMIEGAGVTVNSVVHRSQQGLSEAAFEQKISEGAPLDLALQKKFYISIDGQSSIKQLTDNLRLPRSEWVPLISNLIKVSLATFTTAGSAARKSITVEPKRLDLVVVEQFAHQLKKPDTGAFSYQAFNYFLHQEFLRYKRTEAPVALILIDIRAQKPGQPVMRGTLNPQTVSSVVQTLNSLKRDLDLIFHYEGQSLAILMPHTHAHEAVGLARRAVVSVNDAKFMVGMEKLVVSIVVGVASIPGDMETTGELLAAAELAKERASNTPDGVQLFSELS
jgi:diguanylate cyclase (GGDEF)-like protein